MQRDPGGTLATRLEHLDRERFVGRKPELEVLEQLLEDEPAGSVVLVHGPGGIGKSTLLRELARRAGSLGRETFFVEGRELTPAPDALEAALSAARTSHRPLVLIDTYERMTALDPYLRRGVLPTLPASAVVVIAGRHPPDAAWFEDGWEGVASELELAALPADEALQLVERRGVYDARADAIVAWAGGSPLALALGADAAASHDWDPADDADSPEILRPLIRRLAEAELHTVRLSALAVAAIARVTTVELLGDVLPDSDAEGAYERLRSLTFVEPLGDGLTLHELVRKSLRSDFRRRDPDRDRELRRRIVDHLFECAGRGEPLMTIEMAHLIDSPLIKWGFGWEGSAEYRIDDVRPGDAEQIAALLDERNFGHWWSLTRRFFEEAPSRVGIARDRQDRLCGYMVCMSPATAPQFAFDEPIVGPWLAHAKAHEHIGDAVLWHDSVDFTGAPDARVQAMLGVSGILRSGAPNPRFAYLPINPRKRSALLFAQALGATHLRDLDREAAGHSIECHRIDYGPGGLIAAQRDVVYAEIGLPSPKRRGPQVLDRDVVRDALRNFHLPHELARSPLASGDRPDQRADSVRELLRAAAERAFGESENEKLLQRVLVRGYLEPGPSHEQAALDLALSRAAYFRRLRTAATRVADHIVETHSAP